jgi:hypothetical protein
VSISTTHTDQYFIDGLAQNNSSIINEIYKKYSHKIYNWIKQNAGLDRGIILVTHCGIKFSIKVPD